MADTVKDVERPMHWSTKLMVFGVSCFLVGEGNAVLNKVPGDTWSEKTREYFHIKGKFGTLAFLGMWGTFAAWYSAHIIKQSSGAPNI